MKSARKLLVERAPECILAASVAILGGALASQYWGGLTPCQLCIWQRWPYVATILAGLAALALFGKPGARRALVAFCGVAFAIGGAIAVYHVGVEEGWFEGLAACSGAATAATTLEDLRRQLLAQPVVRCDEIQWSLFGVSMAGYNAIASAGLVGFAGFAVRRMKGEN